MKRVCLPQVHAGAIEGLPQEIQAVVWDGLGEPPAGIDTVGFLVARQSPEPLSAGVLTQMPNLEVIQLVLAGVESWIGHVPPSVTLCGGRGIHGTSVAELAIAGMLCLVRDLPYFADEQREHHWSPKSTDSLFGKGILILGPGDIGRKIASGVEVFGAVPTLVGRPEDGVETMDHLCELLPKHHIVVLSLPLTPRTEGLVDEIFLSRMPDGAMLVNISRGSLVDTDALVAELNTGRLKAFLDVVDPEPLPTDHPLWDAPGVVLTPHVAGGTLGWQRQADKLIHDQIVRWYEGKPLINVVGNEF